MHYMVHAFVAPGDDLEDAMAPFSEGLEEGDKDTAWSYSGGKWDWWSIGGRWDGYWGNENVVTALDIKNGMKGRFNQPYAFLTLPRSGPIDGVSNLDVTRSWFEREIYVSEGYWAGRERGDGLSYFIDAPHYAEHYDHYVSSVPDDTLVYAVDVHR